MRIVEFADGAQSETTPVIGNIVASALVQYPDDVTYEATEQGAPATGNLYYNTTLNLIRYYTGSSWISIVDESSTQTLTNKSIDADNNTITNIDNDEIKTGAAIDATKIHDGSVDNKEFGYLDGVTSNIQTQLDGKQNTSEKDQPNGYAGLDANGRILASAVPEGFLQYQGTWNASTNTPTLTDGVGEQGDVYRTSVAGTQDLGSGNITFAVGDWVTYNGTIWERSDFVGAQSISDLSDVDTTGVIDGQALVYNNGAGEWQPGNIQNVIQENIAFVGRGTADWSTGPGTLVIDTDCFISVPPLPDSYHTIQAQTINIEDGECAYVTLDRSAAMTTNLTVTVDDITNVTPDNNILIIARVVGTECFVGLHDLQRIADGEIVELQKGNTLVAEINTITTNILSANVTSDGTVTDLTFNGLEIGQWYEVRGNYKMQLDVAASDVAMTLSAIHNGVTIDSKGYAIDEISAAGLDESNFTPAFVFQADATSLTFLLSSASGNSRLVGNGNLNSTYVQLERRNDLNAPTLPVAGNTSVIAALVEAGSGNAVNNSTTPCVFTSVIDDPDGIYAGGIFTIPAGGDGLYELKGACGTAVNGSGIREGAIFINGSPVRFGDIIPANGSFSTPGYVSSVEKLVAGDTIQFGLFQNSGSSLAFTATTSICYASVIQVRRD